MTLAPPTNVNTETTLTFHDEQLTVKVARLLLEVNEGWMGYHHDTNWNWHEETYKVLVAICCDRKWLYNSKAACISMLQAIRTGTITVLFNNDSRSSDGYVQWSLAEMHELGAQMRRVVDDERQTVCWAAQLERFIQNMMIKNTHYTMNARVAADFAARAEKFVPKRTLLLIDADLAYKYGNAMNRTVNRKKAKQSSSSMEPVQQTLWATSRNIAPDCEQWMRWSTQAQTMENTVRCVEEPILLGRNIRPTTQATTVGMLPFQVGGDRQSTGASQHVAGVTQSFLPLDTMGLKKLPSIVDHNQASDTCQKPPSPRKSPLCQKLTFMRDSSCQTEWSQTSSGQSADQARSVDETQYGGVTAMQQPTKTYQRLHQSSINDHVAVDNGHVNSTKTTTLPSFRNFNPYDRPGKLWGEFVVDVLLAEKTASNNDELDYV